MFTVTRFCVQPFHRRGRVLVRGEARQFFGPEDALDEGRRASRRADAVGVYRIDGEPATDTWSEPQTLATYGSVPGVG